jgi:siroheme synthase-like protein
MPNLLPLFLDVGGREVLLVGGGAVAAAKLRQLMDAGAVARVVAPRIVGEIASAAQSGRVEVVRREFTPSDLEGVWLVVAAATGDVNRQVAAAAHARRVFVNAVDDPANASAFMSGVLRRAGLTIALSTAGEAPALTALVREALDAMLPRDLADWLRVARHARTEWRRIGVPMPRRKPLLLRALNALYDRSPAAASLDDGVLCCDPVSTGCRPDRSSERGFGLAVPPAVPWLASPEDSWL